MSGDLPIDPDLRGLLVELAERPDHVALGARVHRFQDLLRPETVTLRPTTGMGMLEAKLLAAHREELAHLLLQASQVQVADAVLLRPRDRHGNARTVDPSRWRRSAATYVESRLAQAEPIGPLDLLKRALAQDGREPTARDLAIASLRLVPRTATTIWVGVHYGLEGDRERGIQLQRSVLHDSIGCFHKAYAWSNIAWLSCEARRFHDALEAGRQATILEPGMPRNPIAWFLSAVQVGSHKEASPAAVALAGSLVNQRDFLPEYIQGVRALRTQGSWTPTPTSHSLIQRLSEHVPLEAELLLEAFA